MKPFIDRVKPKKYWHRIKYLDIFINVLVYWEPADKATGVGELFEVQEFEVESGDFAQFIWDRYEKDKEFEKVVLGKLKEEEA